MHGEDISRREKRFWQPARSSAAAERANACGDAFSLVSLEITKSMKEETCSEFS
jgi:hypothetical protein